MARGKLGPGHVFSTIFFLVIALYFVGSFLSQPQCTAAMLDDPATSVDESQHGCESTDDTYLAFNLPTDTEAKSLTIVKMGIIGLLVFVGYVLANRFLGGTATKRDVMTLILIGVAAYFLWPLLTNVLNLPDWNITAFAVGQKLGVLG